MAHSKTSKQAVTAAQLRVKIIELRKQGLTHAEIAAEVGVVRTTVTKHLSAAMADLATQRLEGANDLRAMELAQLMEVRDRALVAWARYEGQNAVVVVGSGPQAYVSEGEPIDAKGARLLAEVTRVSESIRKMLGLDAPQVVHTASVADMSREDAERILDEMRKLEGDAQ
jgi:predicted transcriptional regulator